MSWYQFLDVLKEQTAEFNYYASIPPWACPNDGEPLIPGPAGSQDTLFCRYDGWQYPRDYVRPQGGPT